MLGFTYTLNEPSQEKNQQFAYAKTNTQISCAVNAHRGLYRHFKVLGGWLCVYSVYIHT